MVQNSKEHQMYRIKEGYPRSAPVATYKKATNFVTQEAYLWEVVNALIKVSLIAGSRLMLEASFRWNIFVVSVR